MTNDPTFSVIIPVYNKWDLTVQCLKSLKDQTLGYDYEVIVVDNDSKDATKTQLQDLGSSLFGDKFKALRLSSNQNFGPACNLGALEARSPWLFFLNNDTILTPNWATPLFESLEQDPKLGAVGPLLLYDNNTVQHAGIAFSVNNPLHLYRYFPADHPLILKDRYVQALTAAALMLKRSDFLDLGGFYPEYKNGFEDVDLSLLLGQKGLKLKCQPKSIIYHLEGQTPGRNDDYNCNRQILTQRFGSKYQIDLHIIAFKDGLVPYVADNLDLNLSLHPNISKQLSAQAEGESLDFLKNLIAKNPLWQEGRKFLASLAHSQGNYQLEILLYSEIAFWSKSKVDYQKLLSLKSYVDNPDEALFSEAQKMLTTIENKNKDLNILTQLLRSIKNRRDKFLYKLYMDKYKSLAAELNLT